MEDLISQLKTDFNLQVNSISSVSGGDINEALKVATPTSSYFLKFNDASFADDMFSEEAKALELIAGTKSIQTPKVVGQARSKNGAFLLLEWIDSGSADNDFWISFGHRLALLHLNSSDHYGLDSDNYIGRLKQVNTPYLKFEDFYFKNRLEPQFRIAFDQGYFSNSDLNMFDKFNDIIKEIVPRENPALIHGDLWSGNFLVSTKGLPVLIDPALSYGHRESDLAMTRLFGGFHPAFYEAYNEAYPLQGGYIDRIGLFQLYFLLVHVNLFGSSYVSSCTKILRSYN